MARVGLKRFRAGVPLLCGLYFTFAAPCVGFVTKPACTASTPATCRAGELNTHTHTHDGARAHTHTCTQGLCLFEETSSKRPLRPAHTHSRTHTSSCPTVTTHTLLSRQDEHPTAVATTPDVAARAATPGAQLRTHTHARGRAARRHGAQSDEKAERSCHHRGCLARRYTYT